MHIPSITLRSYIHTTIANILRPTSFAIDATCGNGHDTAFLAQHISAAQHIYAFDVQHKAIVSTYNRLHKLGKLDTTTLFHIGHETLYATLSFHTYGALPQCDAILFNLGYLPHSDKRCITQTKTTLQAITQACSLLSLGGILSIHTYHGHHGGYEEYSAIDTWSKALPTECYHSFTIEQHNKRSHYEVVFIIQNVSKETLPS